MDGGVILGYTILAVLLTRWAARKIYREVILRRTLRGQVYDLSERVHELETAAHHHPAETPPPTGDRSVDLVAATHALVRERLDAEN